MATQAPVASTTVADNSAFGGPSATQAAAANAALGNPTSTAIAPTTVPTTAPAGQTSTTAPQATPTTVVSSQPASTTAQGMVGTLTQAQQDIANQQSIKAANAANEKAGLVATGSSNSSTFVTPNAPTTTPPTPEETIANTPDTGNQWIYDAQGNKSQVPIGSAIPTGYSTTNPTTGPTVAVTDTTTDPVGNVYKQFADGTYGKFNAAGAYVGVASSSDFTQSKNGESLLNSMNEVANGTYPLTANQQAQVDGIKAQFASLIATQQVANANLTGGTTVAENLYGMGNTLTGLGEIKGTVDSGIQKIADLNSQLVSAVAQMESGFQTDDMSLLKGAYDTYSSTVQARQTELDTIDAAAAKALSDAQAQKQAADEFQKTEQDKVTAAIGDVLSTASEHGAPASVIAAIKAAPDQSTAIAAAGEYLQASTDPTISSYLFYKQQADAAGVVPQDFTTWQAAQTKQANSDAYNKAFATAAGSAAGSASVLDPNNPSPGGDDNGNGISNATGLSIGAFNFLTGNTSALSRLTSSQREAIMTEANNYVTKNGVDLATFQAQYKAINTVLSANIVRENNVQIKGQDVTTTAEQLIASITPSDLSSEESNGFFGLGSHQLSVQNIADLAAGKQVNNAFATSYGTNIALLTNDLASYLAASRSNSPTGAANPDDQDIQDAAKIVSNGMNSGSLTAFSKTIQTNVDKVAGVSADAVTSAQQQVWDLFGVGSKYAQQTNSTDTMLQSQKSDPLNLGLTSDSTSATNPLGI